MGSPEKCDKCGGVGRHAEGKCGFTRFPCPNATPPSPADDIYADTFRNPRQIRYTGRGGVLENGRVYDVRSWRRGMPIVENPGGCSPVGYVREWEPVATPTPPATPAPPATADEREVCYCGDYMDEHSIAGSCLSPRAMPQPPAYADPLIPKDVPGAAAFRDALKKAVPPRGADHVSWVNGYCAGWIACEKAPAPAPDDDRGVKQIVVTTETTPDGRTYAPADDAGAAERAVVEALPTRGDVGRPEMTRDPVFLLRWRPKRVGPHRERWHVEGVWFTREEAERFAEAHAYRWGSDRHGPCWQVYCVPAEGELARLLKAVTKRDAALRGTKGA